jgi:hypothetical protein
VSENTAWFSDRPYRETGVTSTADFVSAWGAGSDSFASEPPNADFSCEVGGEVVNYFVELTNPVLSGGDLSYTVSFIGGGPAAGVAQCDHDAHLFIDNAQTTSGGGGDCQQCGADPACGLIDRGEGFFYDSQQNLTWVADNDHNGSSGDGLDTWYNQLAWVAGYSRTHSEYGTFDDWRLPTGGDSYSDNYPGNEMRLLFRDDDWLNAYAYDHAMDVLFWSGTVYAPNPDRAWTLAMSLDEGHDCPYAMDDEYYDVDDCRDNPGDNLELFQDHYPKSGWAARALAVRDGDVACRAAPQGSWQESCNTNTAYWQDPVFKTWCAWCDAWVNDGQDNVWTLSCIDMESCASIYWPRGDIGNNNGVLQCSP